MKNLSIAFVAFWAYTLISYFIICAVIPVGFPECALFVAGAIGAMFTAIQFTSGL